MAQTIEFLIRDLVAARDALWLYSNEHPEFLALVERAHGRIVDALKAKSAVVIVIVGDEFIYENEILFELSKRVKPTIEFLKKKGVERLSFHAGVCKEEVEAFLEFLKLPPDTEETPESFLARHNVTHIEAGNIKILKTAHRTFQELKEMSASRQKSYEKSLDVVSDTVDTILDAKDVNVDMLKATITHVMMNIVEQYQNFLQLSVMKRYDVGTFVHMLSVCILSMYFGARLGLGNEDVLSLGMAALFHDIGKLYISRKIIRKPEKLSRGEFETMRRHTMLGSQILLSYVQSLGPLPVVVAYEHHVKYNMQGYPKLSPLHRPHIASQIVSLCDVYAALTQRRSYKTDFSPSIGYDIMLKGRGKDFNPELFDRFFAAVGVWPVGTIVALNDGRIAVVREQNEENVHRPVVEIVHPKPEQELVNLVEHTALQVDRSLHPRTDGKQFLT